MSAQIAHTRIDSPREWSRNRLPRTLQRYFFGLGVIVFIAYSMHYMNIDLARLAGAYPRLGALIAENFFPPDVAYVLQPDALVSILNTVQMALLGGTLGVLVAVPLAWFSAANVTVDRLVAYPLARFAIIGARAIHETIWTVLFVMVLGFGMLSGVLALTMYCIGFAGKLFTHEIEAVDMGPIEALRSAGASPLQVFQYGVLPQVRVAFAGIAIYTWDVAFRAATVVGFFGGGGMGWYLKQAMQELNYQRVAAVLLAIIAFVVVSEIGSGWLRKTVRNMK